MSCLATASFAPIGRRVTRCILDRDDELSKRARRRPQSCTERALYSSKRSVERLIVRAKLQHRLLKRAIQDLERERVELEAQASADADADADGVVDVHALETKAVLSYDEELLIDM